MIKTEMIPMKDKINHQNVYFSTVIHEILLLENCKVNEDSL